MQIQGPTPVIEKIWKPFPKQEMFLRIPDTIFEGFFAGAAGPGKTDCLIMYGILRGFVEHQNYKGLFIRRTFPELEQEVIPRTREWYAPMGATYNETKKRWTFPSGAIEQLGHAEHEKDITNYDSSQWNLLKWDEATHATPWQYQYLTFERCRSATDLPAICRSASNPGNISHEYFRKRFVDPWKTGGRILIDGKTGLKRIYIPATLFDNPVLMEKDPTYRLRLEMLPEAEKKAKLYGDWYTFKGQVFKEFRLEPLSDEPANARHVVPYIDIPFWWPKFLAIDWGYTAKTVAGWGAASPDGRLYIYRTKSWEETHISIWAPEVADLSRGEELRDAVICHSAGQQRGEPLTVQQQVQNALDAAYGERTVNVRLGEKDRQGGKTLLHEYLRWEQKPKIKPQEGYNHVLAMKILTVYGETKYHEYCSFFTEQPDEQNLPKLQILNSSPEGYEPKELVDCIPSCVYQEANKDGKIPEDVKEFKGDDPYDMLRMLVRAHHRFVTEVKSEAEERAKIGKIYENLATTGNQTAFYREMEKFDADSNIGNSIRLPRRLGHRRFR